MTTQRQELVTQPFNFVPTTLKEAIEYATIFANSGLCPEAYKGRPNDILIVWQLGKEIGLDKMQSLRTLGCVNGMPFAYGDGQLALIKRHRDYEEMDEWFEGDIKDGTLTAYCTMKRKNQKAVTRSFSIEDAKLAGLWSKKGVWQQYPKRMLQHRARGFASKDAYPDALYGLKSEYEVLDIVDSNTVVERPKVKNKGMAGLEESLGIVNQEAEIEKISEHHPDPDLLGNGDCIEGEIVVTESNGGVIDSTVSEFLTLLIEKNIPERSRNKWCKQFNVDVVDDIPIEGMKKIINHLNKKEQ